MKSRWFWAVTAFLCVLPLLMAAGERTFELRFLTGLLIWGLLALSLDLVWGYGGIISLGQGVFFGLGAYAMGFFLTTMGGAAAPFLGVLVGLGLSMAVAMLLAFVSFRASLSGLFFAILTVALAITATLIATAWRDVTGGDNGLGGVPQLAFILPLEETGEYYIVLAVVLGAYLLTRRLVNSHFGMVLRGLRENELRTRSIGFDAAWVKTLAFTFSAGLAATGGLLFAVYNGIVSPTLVGFVTGANALIWVGIGGRGYLVGAFVGVFVVEYVRFYMTDVLTVAVGSEQALAIWPLIFGFVFLLVILFYPDGLIGFVRGVLVQARGWRRILGRRTPRDAAGPS